MEKDNLKNSITNDIKQLVNGIEPQQKTTDDILQELTKSIDKIDFEILAFPDIEAVRNDIESLKPICLQ